MNLFLYSCLLLSFSFQLIGEETHYPVNDISFEYANSSNTDLPKLHELSEIELHYKIEGNLVSFDKDIATTRLKDIFLKGSKKLSRPAIKHLTEKTVQFFNDKGIAGVFAIPSPDHINNKGKDLRKDENLKILIWLSLVKNVKTKSLGDKLELDNDFHQRVKFGSPVSPENGGIIDKTALEEYVFRLNRHPSRRVDVSLSSADQEGGVELEYLVSELKTWRAYLQTSNTGNDATNELRSRLGFVDYQFTGHDDILTLDYIRAGFDSNSPSSSYLFSYELPVYKDFLRLKSYASYHEYNASDIGFFSSEFKGESWNAGLELTANVYQYNDWFLDLFVGARYEDISTEDVLLESEAHEKFLVAYTGLSLERSSFTTSTSMRLNFEWSEPSAFATSSDRLAELGRVNPDLNWQVFKYNLHHSFFIEPLLWGNLKNKTSPAHELVFNLSGQHSSKNRLIPQLQMTAGGLYNVRGYSESEIIGDNALLFSVEYRMHLSRLIGKNSGNNPNGRTDFFNKIESDLIWKVFYDYGRTTVSQADIGELTPQQVESLGMGLEWRFMDHFIGKIDWAYAMQDVAGADELDLTNKGDTRVHFSLTYLF